MSDLPFAANAPKSVSRVGLKARNPGKLSEFYQNVVGLRELSRDGEAIALGAGERPLLVLEGDSALKQEDPRSAGLFHTAFLLPTRADLGLWIKHAMEKQIPVDGASDHIVSEALYLTDPEGNGIEIYADRPRGSWKWNGSEVEMATYRMDVEGVLNSIPAGSAGWSGFPENSIVGHVHLRVGDPKIAEEWWNSEMGFDTVAHYGRDAVFLSTGGYHHHIGANAWQSRGAGPRQSGTTGLDWVELIGKDAGSAKTVLDPWGTTIRTV
ncbi:MAG: VOC family protein [Rhizobiaceae bacterium]|nr:VOC family protein [Rhizobiaceae bacterium]